MPTSLTPFENHDVVGTSIKVTKAGDGLSDALKVEPAEYELDEKVYVLLETTVADVHFPPSKDNADARIRVHVLKAGLATVVPDSKAQPMLAAQRKKLEAAEGVNQLPGLDEGDDGEGDEG